MCTATVYLWMGMAYSARITPADTEFGIHINEPGVVLVTPQLMGGFFQWHFQRMKKE